MNRADKGRVIKCSILFALSLVLLLITVKPEDAMIQQIQYQFKVVGLFFIILQPVFTQLYRIVSNINHNLNFISDTLESISLNLALYAFTLNIIGKLGDKIKNWISVNTNDFIVVAVTLVILFFFWIFTSRISDKRYTDEPYSQLNTAQSMLLTETPSRKKLTERDMQFAAAHEAGHALCYFALNDLPKDIAVGINYKGNSKSVGFVSAIESPHTLNNKTFSEWTMIMLLAGQFAEHFSLGQHTIGSFSDHQKWQSEAIHYLCNHFDGIYFFIPENEFQAKINADCLKSLRKKQIAMLQDLFEANEDVFQTLSQELSKKQLLGKSDLMPFMQQVKIPELFPRPKL